MWSSIVELYPAAAVGRNGSLRDREIFLPQAIWRLLVRETTRANSPRRLSVWSNVPYYVVQPPCFICIFDAARPSPYWTGAIRRRQAPVPREVNNLFELSLELIFSSPLSFFLPDLIARMNERNRLTSRLIVVLVRDFRDLYLRPLPRFATQGEFRYEGGLSFPSLVPPVDLGVKENDEIPAMGAIGGGCCAIWEWCRLSLLF